MTVDNDLYFSARTEYRNFAESVVAPNAATVDDKEIFPEDNVRLMADKGLFGIPIPKEYGGLGLDNINYSICIEELARTCGTTAVILSTHTSLCAWPILEFGTEDQKKKYLPDLAKGKTLGAFGLTEPKAGTDASQIETTAVLDGDEYVLNGKKRFITNAGRADIYVIFAMTDKSKGTKGISAFIVEKGTDGFEFGHTERKMGIRGSVTRELLFNNCRIPKNNLLGEIGSGFKIAMKTLDGGRIGIASQALGIAQGAIDETIRYTKDRVQFGRSISDFQNTKFQIADMDAQVDAARQLVYKAAGTKDKYELDKKTSYSLEAARAKLFSSNTAMAVTTKCLQLYGGNGYTRDYPIERMMRDAKITEIYEGTSEVQRMVIAGMIF